MPCSVPQLWQNRADAASTMHFYGVGLGNNTELIFDQMLNLKYGQNGSLLLIEAEWRIDMRQ